MPAKETELAWAAGFIDGEGCIDIVKRPPRKRYRQASPSYDLILTVSNTNLQPLMRLQSMFKGAIRHAKILGNRRNAYTLSLSDRQTEHCLKLILPYLNCKREQAELALQFRRGLQPGRRRLTRTQLEFRELCFQKMKILNGVGRKARQRVIQLDLKELTREIQATLPLLEPDAE